MSLYINYFERRSNVTGLKWVNSTGSIETKIGGAICDTSGEVHEPSMTVPIVLVTELSTDRSVFIKRPTSFAISYRCEWLS